MDGKLRKNIQIGAWVAVIQKHHQQSGELTEGEVKRILTNSPNHPHGIKVLLGTGERLNVPSLKDLERLRPGKFKNLPGLRFLKILCAFLCIAVSLPEIYYQTPHAYQAVSFDILKWWVN